ncbi:hypothetical protein Ciccas_005755 [Cichlidogyrus casuarinus]|uniref:carnosine N-methyltransferase n=1 Tax=Cichlidogyrus casuarinus TaxID=1844966 RepID=A0ABD2QA54_9PLAT
MPNIDKSLSEEKPNYYCLKVGDMDKVRTVFKQLVRDWSSAGAEERNSSYKPVIDEIENLFPQQDRDKISILVPGAGLGRLAWELSSRGFSCQGNEFSLYMLIPSYFVINFTIKPYLSQTTNVFSREDQLASVSIPDVDPSCISGNNGPFSMAAGDFLDVYTQPDTFNCVATVFFLDTAHNLLDYLENIALILKPGGYWINLGPLLYHFFDMPGEFSMEFSYEEIRTFAFKMGFKLIKEETDHKCSYTQNPKSMIQNQYSCVFSVWQKQ